MFDPFQLLEHVSVPVFASDLVIDLLLVLSMITFDVLRLNLENLPSRVLG